MLPSVSLTFSNHTTKAIMTCELLVLVVHEERSTPRLPLEIHSLGLQFPKFLPPKFSVPYKSNGSSLLSGVKGLSLEHQRQDLHTSGTKFQKEDQEIIYALQRIGTVPKLLGMFCRLFSPLMPVNIKMLKIFSIFKSLIMGRR